MQSIKVTEQESDNFYHYHDNRVMPPHVDAKLADAEGASPPQIMRNTVRCIAEQNEVLGHLQTHAVLLCLDLNTNSATYLHLGGAGWWFNPDWIINELGLNSTITSPMHEEVVTLDTQKDYVVRGYAYSSELQIQLVAHGRLIVCQFQLLSSFRQMSACW